nr:hypothetical protein [Tanacetum cinerariifolium]
MQTQTSSVLHNDTISSCSTSNVKEKTQLSRSRCMHSLREVKKQFKFLSKTLQDFGTMPIFKRTFSQDLDLLEQHLTKDKLSQTDFKTTLKNLRTKFENAFNSEFKELMHRYTRFDAQSLKDVMIYTMDSIGKYMLEIILHQQWTPHLLKQKKLMQTQEDHSNPIRALNTQESKIDMGKAVNDDLVVTESSGPELEVQDDNSRPGNDTDADDADIRPIYDEEPMATIQLTAEYEAKKKTQERDRNAKTSVMTPVRFQSTVDDSKPKPRSTNHSSRSLHMSKSSCVTITAMPKADHSKSPRSENLRAKIQSHKTRDRNKPVDQKSHTQILGRQIFTGHMFFPNKTSVVYEKISPRSDLSKVESEPPHGSNVDISKINECKQTLDLSAGTSINVSKEQSLDVCAEVPSTDTIVMTSMIELESLFDPSFNEYFDGENRVVSKPSAVTTADTSDKRQQQPDLTSSTSSLATTVTADGNFDL